jgi:hypothetical protein
LRALECGEMPRAYGEIKAALNLAGQPFLSAFEQYCQDMRCNTRVLEWSCKVTCAADRGIPRLNGSRFLHTALHSNYDLARAAVDKLFSTLPAGDESSLFWRLPSIAATLGEGIALGYAEEGGRAELKLYISTSKVLAARRTVEEIVPAGGVFPDNTGRLMIAASLDGSFECKSRVYYLWNSTQLQSSAVLDWLDRWCSREELRLILGSATSTLSLAFKNVSRDMIYLSSPFKHAEVNEFIVRSLSNFALPFEQLADLRWIGFSKYGEGLPSAETNFYFNSYY